MKIINLLILIFFINGYPTNNIYPPTNYQNQKNKIDLKLTKIGQFGLLRKPRPNIPAHFHTGIDIIRSGDNYSDEPVFPIAVGKVISKREDGPYANIIIEHEYENIKFWSLYEHISKISVNLDDKVDPKRSIACFLNKTELNLYGWQFDHFHLEILKVEPKKVQPDKFHPQLHYRAYTLDCYTEEDLNHYYYNPIEFLNLFPDILFNQKGKEL